ncbi:MAG TPA: hypothetical protein VFP12_04930 [Allosphingosinicella sp.]|nr:hypothetical protein [Allosphingosinicella sp.]
MSVAALHPAQRRRIAAMMPDEAPHEVKLRALGNGDLRTLIVTSAERRFVEALFEDLTATDWKARLAAMRGVRRGTDGVLELSLPIHRKFQLALFEVVCEQPGHPRLDPAKLASQGMVLRRYARSAPRLGWVRQGKQALGWKRVDEKLDPDPAMRAQLHQANAAVRGLIAQRNAALPVSEEVIDLFPAPPRVCEALRRTVLFGIIPVVGSERSDSPPPALDYSTHEQRADFEAHLSGYLRARAPLELPRAGQALDPDWNVLDPIGTAEADRGRLNSLGLFLQQAMVELDALGGGRAANALMKVLAEIRLPTARDGRSQITASVDAATFVRRAGPILIEGAANGDGFAMPLDWPRMDSALGARLTAAALACLTARHGQVQTPEGQFDDPADLFAIRPFVRVRGHDGCPDRLVWGPYSEPFRVCAWWDGDGPGTKISLPDFSQLKKVKPNVAFEMPPALANLLKGPPKDLMEGKGSTSGLELGWLCSFSIPIITLCAFICLNIFLSLFDLFLKWMMFIKICIPIPKKSGS